MKQLMTGLLVSALLLVGGVPWAMADQILLRQSDGTMTPWGGVGEKGSVTCDNCSGGGGGAGGASLAEQQTQTGILGTIDADTGTIAGAVKAEDAAHASGDTGVMSLCVRQDTAAALAGTNGDYIPCATDATGRMWTNTELPDAAALADTTANPTVPGVGSYNMCWNGSTWDRCVKASAGAGNSDSSTQRVVVARDSDVCNAKDTAQVVISTASSGNVELVALTSGQTIYICDFTIMSGGTVGVQLIYGTGTACATGETNMTGVMPLVANAGWTHNYGGRLKTAEANAFCIELSGAVQVDGVVTYRKMATF